MARRVPAALMPKSRAILYMDTVAAIRLNPLMRAFYARLRAAGKSSKMALTACMRKLIVVLNAMLRAGDRWSDEGPQRVKISARYLDMSTRLLAPENWRSLRRFLGSASGAGART